MILFKNIFMQIFCIFLLLILLLLFQVGEIECKTVVKRGIMDDFNKGIKYAGQMMGINTAADVANLVAKAFSSQNIVKKKDTESPSSYYDSSTAQSTVKDDNNNNFSATQLISGMLKMMGFDSGKLGALALNGLIMIAQMIGSAFIPGRGQSVPQPEAISPEHFNEGEQQQPQYQTNSNENLDNPHTYADNFHQPRMERKVREGSPLDWILDNPSKGMSKLLNNIRDKELPNYLTETVDKLEQEKGDGDCIKMLICKSSPFIWGMQRNVRDRIDGTSTDDIEDENRLSAFFKYLPDIKEYKKNGKMCEEKYIKCNPNPRVLK